MSHSSFELKSPAINTETFFIPAMDCPVEEDLIKKRLAGAPGIKDMEFDLINRRFTVDYASPANPGEIKKALIEIGMEPREADSLKNARNDMPWKRLVWGCILALCSELMELMPHFWPGVGNLSQVLACLFAIAAVITVGVGTFKNGWLALMRGTLNINALMAVAVTGSICIGQFPEAAMVMTLFELSEALEGRAMARARNAIKNLLDLAPLQATVLTPNGEWQEELVDNVRPGDILRVRPGEKIGMDGIVTKGRSAVNQAPITGESMPVEKGPGDKVYAGAINEDGSFEFRATAKSSDTTLARIIKAVEEAQATKAPVQRFVDKFARYYTPAIFALSVISFLVSLAFHGWHESIYMALVILVIGCPCALVISTPVSIVSALSRAATQGILIKGGAFLEEGKNLDWIVLDKTGTITKGEPEVVAMESLDTTGGGDAPNIACALASLSDHPVSRAIAGYGTAKKIRLPEVTDFRAIPGKGIEGKIDGVIYRLGKPALGCGNNDVECARKAEEYEKNGATVAILFSDKPLALFVVADTIKPSSLEAMAQLKKLGVKTMLLSGDNAGATAAIAQKTGVDEYRGNLLPNEKMDIVDKLRASGHKVGMAGDGINDAPALARADIGFAMAGAGTDTAIETASVALMDDDLRKLARFIRLSHDTTTIITENIVFALAIKAIVFALALAGLATMWMAVLADVGATLCVVANGMRLLRK